MSPLGERLRTQLAGAFPDVARGASAHANTIAVFRSPHHDVGEAELLDDAGSITLHLGRFTHVHFEGGSQAEGAGSDDLILAETLDYLGKLFADRIEFFGTGRNGGSCERGDRPRGWLSRWMFGRRSWVWSGPLDPAA